MTIDLEIKPSMAGERNKKVQAQAVMAVIAERLRQDHIFGGIQNNLHSPAMWVLVIREELDEFKQEILDGRDKEMEEELVHVAATAMAALEVLYYKRLK